MDPSLKSRWGSNLPSWSLGSSMDAEPVGVSWPGPAGGQLLFRGRCAGWRGWRRKLPGRGVPCPLLAGRGEGRAELGARGPHLVRDTAATSPAPSGVKTNDSTGFRERGGKGSSRKCPPHPRIPSCYPYEKRTTDSQCPSPPAVTLTGQRITCIYLVLL